MITALVRPHLPRPAQPAPHPAARAARRAARAGCRRLPARQPDASRGRRASRGRLLADFGLAVLLPLVAVIVGTAAVGSELDDGTIVYLLAKPVPRWLIVLVKFVVAWVVSSLLVAVPHPRGGLVGAGGDPAIGIGYAMASVGRGARVHRRVPGAVARDLARARRRAGVRRHLGRRGGRPLRRHPDPSRSGSTRWPWRMHWSRMARLPPSWNRRSHC